MRPTDFSRTGIGFGVVATVAVLLACNDSPAAPADQVRPTDAAFAQAEKKEKAKTMHFARVRSDGVLVDGTATSASRAAAGVYHVRFDAPIDGCAATAGAAFFPGADTALNSIIPNLGIGIGPGGQDARSVAVLLLRPDGNTYDSSFVLALVCP